MGLLPLPTVPVLGGELLSGEDCARADRMYKMWKGSDDDLWEEARVQYEAASHKCLTDRHTTTAAMGLADLHQPSAEAPRATALATVPLADKPAEQPQPVDATTRRFDLLGAKFAARFDLFKARLMAILAPLASIKDVTPTLPSPLPASLANPSPWPVAVEHVPVVPGPTTTIDRPLSATSTQSAAAPVLVTTLDTTSVPGRPSPPNEAPPSLLQPREGILRQLRPSSWDERHHLVAQ